MKDSLRLLLTPARDNVVDRLSSLPPELLDEIFLLAYPGMENESEYYYVHPQPISKKLLPFTRNCLFNRLLLEHPDQLDQLVSLLSQRQDLASKVKSLDLRIAGCVDPEEGPQGTVARKIRRLLRLVPDLKTFRQDAWMDDIAICNLFAPVPLLNLTKVSLRLPRIGTTVFDLDDFDWIAALPNLSELGIKEWDLVSECISPEGTVLPIKKLSIEGSGTTCTSVLINACPRLLHLHLVADRYAPDGGGFEALLPLLPDRLETLSLCEPDRAEFLPEDQINRELRRFTRLHTLELVNSNFSCNIDRTLARLRELRTITLAGPQLDIGRLQRLVKGSQALPYLHRIVLKKSTLTEPQSPGDNAESEDDNFDIPGDGNCFDQLAEACAQKGVALEGLELVREACDAALRFYEPEFREDEWRYGRPQADPTTPSDYTDYLTVSEYRTDLHRYHFFEDRVQ
ncbi:uncharacterized protein JCM6883_002002 [Sporobolomyces salmoneus]|uniref:uncharacterized protein n=1 Tax=Sporobolomyces salmoneus TaxID=183962 RepID=UPI00317CBD7D